MKRELISAYEYATRKGVSNTIVYRRMNKGEIKFEVIGKTKYIDWKKYAKLDFNEKKIGTRNI
jgi:predicted DNA-binding transcriptional regulator AlpA